MTKCRWCQRPVIDRAGGAGRPALYCRRSCRQRDYEARRRAAERGLDENEIIVARSRLDAMQDKLWVLAAALQDATTDAEAGEYERAFGWLADAAREAVSS